MNMPPLVTFASAILSCVCFYFYFQLIFQPVNISLVWNMRLPLTISDICYTYNFHEHIELLLNISKRFTCFFYIVMLPNHRDQNG
jgi:hypothetical protein